MDGGGEGKENRALQSKSGSWSGHLLNIAEVLRGKGSIIVRSHSVLDNIVLLSEDTTSADSGLGLNTGKSYRYFS